MASLLEQKLVMMQIQLIVMVEAVLALSKTDTCELEELIHLKILEPYELLDIINKVLQVQTHV